MYKPSIIIFAISLILISSCRKIEHNSNSNPAISSIEDLVIPENFNWSTYNSVNFTIAAENAQVITIKSLDGNTIFHKGFYNTITETYITNVNIPAHISEVLVNDINTPINNTEIAVILTNQDTRKMSSAAIASLPNNAAAIWHFNENNGNTANDSQGNNTGVINGAEWVNGISGSALKFNGEGGNVIAPNSSSLNNTTDKISFSLWFKRDHILDDGAFIFQRMKYVLRIDKWGKPSFAVYNPDWSSLSSLWSERIIDTDWHHIVTTYDGSELKLYLDNKLMNSVETSGNLRSTDSDVYIGSQTSINYFEGSIDEVIIYDKVLSVEEINQIYTTTQNPNDGSGNLISKWDFDEASGSTANDPTGNNNGIIYGANWSSGISGNCLSFDGNDDYVIVPNSGNLNLTNQITIMAWAKAEENKTAKIAQKGDWDGHGIGLDIWQGWKAGIRLSNNSSKSINWNNGRPILNKWYHIAMCYNGNQLKLYVNGQLKNSLAVSGLLKINSRNVSFGSDLGNQKFFKGSLDDIRIYGTALSHTEIQGIFKKQNAVEDKDGDGIPDNEDDYPNDAGRAFDNLFPASSYGSLAFEDLWPGKGDYDFNDLVLDYRFTTITNASNKVSDIKASFVIKAIGAGFSNGFGFQLPNENIQNSDVNVSGYNLTESFITLNENGTETGQNKITVIVFDNAKAIMQANSGFVNVNQTAPYVEPDTIRIDVTFNSDTYISEDINIHDFNPFLIIDGIRGKEVHLPNMSPTDLADNSYFGTMHDNSDINNNRYYKTINNLPWVINIPTIYNYTIEKAEIISGHLKFAEWAESGGSLYPDWYENNDGYRNASNIFIIP